MHLHGMKKALAGTTTVEEVLRVTRIGLAMANFRYKAMTPGGDMVTGTLEAPSQAAAVQQIRSLGHYPISANDAEAGNRRHWLNRELKFRRGPRPRDLAIATQELGMLLDAGLELDRALSILVGLGEIESLRKPFTAVLARVRDGASLADALTASPAFPKLYVSMVRAGEMGGNLEATLGRLAEYLSRDVPPSAEPLWLGPRYPIISACCFARCSGFHLRDLISRLPKFEAAGLFRRGWKVDVLSPPKLSWPSVISSAHGRGHSSR